MHRLNCYSQFKHDIKDKRDVITLMTYQSMDKLEMSGESFNFSSYRYIVCDEFHFFTADSSFNKSTDYSFKAILNQVDKIRIFMSATGDTVVDYMKSSSSNGNLNVISYIAEPDFSFINSLNFYNDEETEELLIDQIISKGEKAIVFINNIQRLQELYLKYEKDSLFNCSESRTEYRHVDEMSIIDMLHDEKFHESILFTTSVMDTGVSIKDKKVSNIICNNITDVNILLQVLGRKRILDSTDKVDVYIKDMSNWVLNGFLKNVRNKLERLDYFNKHGELAYTDRYEREVDTKDILYYKNQNGEIVVDKNNMALVQAKEEYRILKDMIGVGYKDYIAGILGYSKEYKLVELEREIETLEKYLDSIEGKRLYKEDQQELSNLIIQELTTISRDIDYRSSILKHSTLELIIRHELDLPYAISNPKRESVTVDGERTRRRYITIHKFNS